jgi:cysteine-rich repeat protein
MTAARLTRIHAHGAALLALSLSLSFSCGSDDGAMVADTEGSGSSSDPGTSGDSTPMGDSTTGSADDDDPTDPMTTSPTSSAEAVCGDGVVEGIEQCDDGNDVPADGCEIDCTTTYDTSVWQVTHAGEAGLPEAAHGVAIDGAGNPVVVGWVLDAPNDPNVWVRKYDPDGAELWTTTLDPSMGGGDRAWAVALDADDNVLVTGDSETVPDFTDVWVGKLDPGGALLWSDTVDGPAMNTDGGLGIAVDAAGTVAVTGYVRVAGNDNDIYVGTWSSDGTPGWSEVIAGPDALDDRGTGAAFDSAGDLVLSGFVSFAGFNRDVWARKYDPAGTEVWTFQWDSEESGDDAGFAVAIAPDDTIGITGMTPIIATNQDVWLGKLDPEGALVWWKRFGAPSTLHDNGLGLTSNADGDFVIAGFKTLSNVDADIWLRKYDAGGNVVWTQAIGGAGMRIDQAHAIAADDAGELYVAGEIRATESGDADVWVARFGP